MLQSHWENHGLQTMSKITATMCNEVVTMLPLKLLQRLDASVWGGKESVCYQFKTEWEFVFYFISQNIVFYEEFDIICHLNYCRG